MTIFDAIAGKLRVRVTFLLSFNAFRSNFFFVYRMYAVALIIIWLRLMRSCRAFRTLGPFIAILGSVAKDTLKFAFLFFEFFIPYTMAFWIIFGDGE